MTKQRRSHPTIGPEAFPLLMIALVLALSLGAWALGVPVSPRAALGWAMVSWLFG
jgi:hypothetical protein